MDAKNQSLLEPYATHAAMDSPATLLQSLRTLMPSWIQKSNLA
jgi:hypothetical protein